eukprot:2752158-Pyramimonas_sp.AAC.1
MLQQATGKKVVCVGFCPVLDMALGSRALRRVGSRIGSSSLTLCLATQKAAGFAPICAATCDLARRCAAAIWGQRAPLS